MILLWDGENVTIKKQEWREKKLTKRSTLHSWNTFIISLLAFTRIKSTFLLLLLFTSAVYVKDVCIYKHIFMCEFMEGWLYDCSLLACSLTIDYRALAFLFSFFLSVFFFFLYSLCCSFTKTYLCSSGNSKQQAVRRSSSFFLASLSSIQMVLLLSDAM